MSNLELRALVADDFKESFNKYSGVILSLSTDKIYVYSRAGVDYAKLVELIQLAMKKSGFLKVNPGKLMTYWKRYNSKLAVVATIRLVGPRQWEIKLSELDKTTHLLTSLDTEE